MVFSSPLYLDPSHNWPQQQNQQGGGGGTNFDGNDNNQQLPPLPPPSGGGGASVRSGSMSEQARVAKIPQPEAALKCPRCESTNTKFCYFNNYNLSQPRHFCKTCRRYWTRGGALRNVPVGGGCRRNKRSKGSNKSKSSDRGQNGSTSSNSCTNMVSHMVPPQLPILPPLHSLGEFNSGDIGLSFAGIQPLTGASGSLLPNGLVEQWRLQQGQQFPFLSNNLDSTSSGLYSFDGEAVEGASYGGGQIRSKQIDGGGSGVSVVKMEDNGNQGIMNLSRNFLGLSGNYDHQVWGGGNNAWTDLSGFTSSSASHLL